LWRRLRDHIAKSGEAQTIELALVEGETRIAGQKWDDDEDAE
jgi:hypothetical protein